MRVTMQTVRGVMYINAEMNEQPKNIQPLYGTKEG